MRVQGLGFRDEGLGFRGLVFRTGFRDEGLGLKDYSSVTVDA